ncbi:MAG: DJ-1/PfpI family protein [Bacteroidales bacterium]|nr:DJ-1/PfpI family protein [Bacteroidales bacterium]
MSKVSVFFANGFEEIEAITIVDILRRAEIETQTVSVTGNKEVTGAHNMGFMADVLFEEAELKSSDMLVLPGGMPGSSNLQNHQGLSSLLKEYNDKNAKVSAICAAPMVLGGLGILNGKDAVCYPGFEDKLEGANVKEDLVCSSSNIITGRGPGAATNFALQIVTSLKGKQTADTLAQQMLITTWEN